MIDEKRFNELWEQAEAEKYSKDLAAEYPAWRTRTRRRASTMAGLALVVAVALPLTLSPGSSRGYEKVYCNNKAFSESHWTEMADALLMS